MTEGIEARIGERERRYVGEVLDNQFHTSSGSAMTTRLESAFAERFGKRFAISFINGTATMHAVLAAAGIGPGDEVIVPPLTMAATSLAVLQAGATPVFADVDPCTWTISPESIRAVMSQRTRAIIPVAIYGLSPDLVSIMELARSQDLLVLEDDAQCLLGRYRGSLVGTLGHVASFSFQSSKQLTSGEGGMVITDDEGLANATRRFGSLGYGAVAGAAGKGKITREVIQDPEYDRHVSLGWNYRMPELCAAVALAQLDRIEELVQVRQQAANALLEVITDCKWLTTQSVPAECEHVYWTLPVRLNEHAQVSWRDFRSAYMACGGDSLYACWKLTYLEPAFRGKTLTHPQRQTYSEGLCPVAESLQPCLLQLKTDLYQPWEEAYHADILRQTIRNLEGS